MGTKVDLLGGDDDIGGNDKVPTTSNGFKINNAYADRYNNWRQLEEMQKMKDKYGQDFENFDDESSSESEEEWTADDEKNFYRTLGALKGNDPSIYDAEKSYFKDKASISLSKKEAKRKDEKLFLRDYERKIVLEKNGIIDEGDEDEGKLGQTGYFEEQDRIKNELQTALKAHDNDSDDEEFLVRRKKDDVEQKKDDDDFCEWLKSRNEGDTSAEELKSLKKAWNNPQLDKDEQFLRDYLLNKDYEPGDDSAIPTYEEICNLDEDEKEFERQEQYETKYNFRFEEPDQEFIKQYPRTVAESIRRKDSKRKEQRETYRERKRQEKMEKKKEIEQMKNMKKAEINKKLEKLNKLAGNEIPISIDDIEGDFDPAEYDRRMKEIFDRNYYQNVDALEGDLEKPEFSDLSDDEGEESDDPDNIPIGTLKVATHAQQAAASDVNPEAEETQFRGRTEPSKRRKKRNSKFAEAVSREKPLWDPKEKTFEEYFNEYYDLDYEDILGDQRTRFKYRSVMANDFGLSVEDILNADDRQLNAWASVKKATGYRTDAEEKFDVMAYRKKGADTQKKQRIFTTDFGGKKSQKPSEIEKRDSPEHQPPPAEETVQTTSTTKKKKRIKKNKNVAAKPVIAAGETEMGEDQKDAVFPANSDPKKKGRTRKRKLTNQAESALTVDDQRLRAYGINPKKFKNKLRYGKKSDTAPGQEDA